ncbi:hypothetical protein AB1Y20_020975 [Prymnesium parvum]|uniref:Fe2OG dioxygenase domain-containing protein n=1 Tax=Prymnesium parvum TaxID=97485 RepID=A0AB34JIS5_PRYPA
MVPRIDISRFAHGNTEERAEVAAAFDKAFCSVGFCLLVGIEEWLPPHVIQNARAAAHRFFLSSPQAKRRAYLDGVVGYLPPGAENVSSSAGTPSASPDPVESLNLPGYQERGSEWQARLEGCDCPWEKAPWLPEDLTRPLAEYWRGATSLMLLLMSLSELALDLPPGYFDKSFERPGTLLRIAWYPPQAPGEETAQPQLRYGEHTDFDGFTLLQREGDSADNPGLEIETAGGEWMAVDSSPGTLTINIGDLLQRWTNRRWRATMHRVAKPAPGSVASTQGRLSVVYFTGPHPETLVECLPFPKCVSASCPPKYAPITALDHVLQKMRAATECTEMNSRHYTSRGISVGIALGTLFTAGVVAFSYGVLRFRRR